MRKCILAFGCVLCLCCSFLLCVPVFADEVEYIIIDYEDYITDYYFSDDYKYITCTFPTEYAQWWWFDASWKTLAYNCGSSISYTPDPAVNFQFYIECQILGAYSQSVTDKYKALKLANIPDGSVLNFNIDLSLSQYDNDFIPPETIEVITYYYSSDHQILGRVTTGVVTDFSVKIIDDYTVWLSVPFQLTIDKSLYPDAAYIDFRMHTGIFECYFTEECTWGLSDFTMKFSVNAMQEVMDELGYQTELLEDINNNLDEIISGGEAGEDLGGASDKVDQGNEELGGALDDLEGAEGRLPEMPDDLEDEIGGYVSAFQDSNVSSFMPWNSEEYADFWNVMIAPTLGAVSIALLLYFVFGKASQAR